MRLLVAAVGKLKDDEERAICARYAKRLSGAGKAIAFGPLEILELVESRAASAAERKADEAARLLKSSGDAGFKIALDVRGRSFDSETFATLLARQRDDGVKTLAFLIGGPDGHGEQTLSAADVTLSLGPLTLPHGLARVVLCEQLYRAATILAGHPYHRA